ncbi:hypothetical protein EDD64_103151 [Effusibacillus lacus]|nr:hypothetical protein EDD64_103151 [Effusibacillus lacus]
MDPAMEVSIEKAVAGSAAKVDRIPPVRYRSPYVCSQEVRLQERTKTKYELFFSHSSPFQVRLYN